MHCETHIVFVLGYCVLRWFIFLFQCSIVEIICLIVYIVDSQSIALCSSYCLSPGIVSRKLEEKTEVMIHLHTSILSCYKTMLHSRTVIMFSVYGLNFESIRMLIMDFKGVESAWCYGLAPAAQGYLDTEMLPKLIHNRPL